MSLVAAWRLSKAQLQRNADWLAVAVAVVLPWSTSATGICVGLWLLALLPTLEFDALRRAVATPAGGFPVLLVALATLGISWTEVPWGATFHGLAPFAKLLMIPLLLIHFSRSDATLPVFVGFLISCTMLLVLSSILATWPDLAWDPTKSRGVPVKDYIAQSGEFVICSVVIAYVVLDQYKTRRPLTATAFLLLATAFLFNILYVATSRTALATIPILLILLGMRQFRWKGVAGIVAAGIVLGSIIWASSPYLQDRVTSLAQEVEAYQVDRQVTSAGERLDFWKKSFRFIAEAPVIGHGTGSITHLFEKAAVGETALWARASTNPHNQILAVGIQLGFLGVFVLFAMWISHLLLFCRQGLIAWIGLAIVVQNIVSSLFNSHLFDFTQGWTYVFGVGVAGGMMLRSRAGPQEMQVAGQAASGQIRPDQV